MYANNPDNYPAHPQYCTQAQPVTVGILLLSHSNKQVYQYS